MKRTWAWAPRRRRRRRVQRKVDARSGAQHYVPKAYRGLPEGALDIRILSSRHRVIQAPSWGAAMAFFQGGPCNVACSLLGEVEVGTVFLRVGYGFRRRKQWFETMVFGGEQDGHTRRYETWNEASEGHRNVVAMLQGKKP